MSRDDHGLRSWSAAGPSDPAWSRLGDSTRRGYNEAAQGKAPAEAGEAKDKPDKATHTHDLEPSLQEKKQGAAYDKGSAMRNFEHFKAGQSQEQARGFDLGR